MLQNISCLQSLYKRSGGSLKPKDLKINQNLPTPTSSPGSPNKKENNIKTLSLSPTVSRKSSDIVEYKRDSLKSKIMTPSVASLTADIATKEEFKYNPEVEKAAQKWIETFCGIKSSDISFVQLLKSGVVLCHLANHIKPNSIVQIYEGNLPYRQMENIGYYISFCQKLGLKDVDLFETADLFVERNLNNVINHIHILAHFLEKQPGWNGPQIQDTRDAKSLFSATLVEERLDQIIDQSAQYTLNEQQLQLVEWANSKMKDLYPPCSFQNLSKDVRSGVVIIRLLSVLCQNQPFGVYNSDPNMIWQAMQNASAILKFISSQTFENVPNVRAIDIVTGSIISICNLLEYLRSKFDLNYLFTQALTSIESYEEVEIIEGEEVPLHIRHLLTEEELKMYDNLALEKRKKELEEKELEEKVLVETKQIEPQKVELEKIQVKKVEPQKVETKQVEPKQSIKTSTQTPKIIDSSNNIKIENTQQVSIPPNLSKEKQEKKPENIVINEKTEQVENEDEKSITDQSKINKINESDQTEEAEQKSTELNKNEIYVENSKIDAEDKKHKRHKKEKKEKKERKEKKEKLKHLKHRSKNLVSEDENLKPIDTASSPSLDSLEQDNLQTKQSSDVVLENKNETQKSEETKEKLYKKISSHYRTPSGANRKVIIKKNPENISEHEKVSKAQQVVKKHIATELITTEQSYLKSLQTLVKGFLEPLKKQRLLSETEYFSIFINFEQIMTDHRKFEVSIRDRISWWNEESILSDIFLKKTDFFVHYGVYILNFNQSSVSLHFLRKKIPKLDQMIQKFEDDLMQTTMQTLDSFMIMPIQRLPRYRLLLSDFRKYSDPNSIEYGELEKVINFIDLTLQGFNSQIDNNATENTRRVLQIATTIRDEQNILKVGRKFVKEGTLFIKKFKSLDKAKYEKKIFEKIKNFKAYLFLLNDSLVVTEPIKQAKGEDKFQFNFINNFEFDQISLIDEKEKNDKLSSFHLKNIDKKTKDLIYILLGSSDLFIIQYSSLEERDSWADTILEFQKK